MTLEPVLAMIQFQVPRSIMGGASSTDCLPLRTVVQIQVTQNVSLSVENVTAQYQKATQPWP